MAETSAAPVSPAPIVALAAAARQLGCTVSVVEARKGMAVLYYTDPSSERLMESFFDELHVFLPRPGKILVAVLPE